MECCIKCKCSSFKTDGLKTGDEQEKGHKNDERFRKKNTSVKICKRQICLVYEKEDRGVNLSQPFNTNMVVGKVVNRVQFQSQSQFSGTKRKKVNNLSCLVSQARQKEMGRFSTPQIWRDTHLPAFTPRHLVQEDTLLESEFMQIQT